MAGWPGAGGRLPVRGAGVARGGWFSGRRGCGGQVGFCAPRAAGRRVGGRVAGPPVAGGRGRPSLRVRPGAAAVPRCMALRSGGLRPRLAAGWVETGSPSWRVPCAGSGGAARTPVSRCMALRSAGSRRRLGREVGRGRASVVAKCRCAGSGGAARTPVSRCMALRSAGFRPRLGREVGRGRESVVAKCRCAGSGGAARTPVSRCMALRSAGSRPRLGREVGRGRASVVAERRCAGSGGAGRTPVSRCMALRSAGSRPRLGREVGRGRCVRRGGVAASRVWRRGAHAGLTLYGIAFGRFSAAAGTRGWPRPGRPSQRSGSEPGLAARLATRGTPVSRCMALRSGGSRTHCVLRGPARRCRAAGRAGGRVADPPRAGERLLALGAGGARRAVLGV